MQHKSILISSALVMCALIVGVAALQVRAQSVPTHAASQPLSPQSVIGNGTPGSCTEAAFATAFNAGGSITFNCGAAPVTITLTSRYTVTVDTAIDGGTLDQIILSGGDPGTGPRNGVGFFAVPAGRSLTLQNMALRQAGDTAIVNAGNLSLVSSRLDYARAASCGSILSVGHVSDNLSLFAYNTVDGNGGGICIQGGTAHLMNDQIVGNVAGGVGGGLYNNGGIIDTYGLYLIGNWALRGGGVYNATGSHLTLLYGVPEYNVASLTDMNGAGGGVDNHGVLTMTGNIVQYNQAYKGAGIANDGRLYLEGSEVQSNATASNDPANNIGGGLLTFAPMVISNTLFALNTSGDATIYAAAPVTLTGVTVAENTALQGTSGLAAYAPASIEFSTFYHIAFSALSPRSASATIKVRGSLFDNGTCEVNANAPHVVSLGHNLSDDDGTTCGLVTSTDIANADPLLSELIVPGWNASLRQPVSDSPAMDAGGLDCPVIDIVQTARPQGAACDIGAIEIPEAIPTPTPEPTFQPATLPAGVHPTINLDPTHAYAGQALTISGHSVPDYNTVRVMSVSNARTINSADVTVAANGTYSLQVMVPASLTPGPIDLCATVTGTANAQLACATFMVDAMPTAQMQGSIPTVAGTTINANLNLIDPGGTLRYVTPINTAGQFNLSGIIPGKYQAVVSGQVAQPVNPAAVTLLPAAQTQIQLPPNVDICRPGQSRSSAYLRVGTPTVLPPSTNYAPANVTARFNVLEANPNLQLSQQFLAQRQRDFFGVYISGVDREEVFSAYPQTTPMADAVIFQLMDANGQELWSSPVIPAPYSYSINMKRLPPSQGDRHPQIWVTPIVNGIHLCPSAFPVHMMEDPMKLPGVKALTRTRWNDTYRHYEFEGLFPGAADLNFPIPSQPLKYFGNLENSFRAGVIMAGTVDDSGNVQITSVKAQVKAVALNVNLYERTETVNTPTPEYLTKIWDAIKDWTIDLGTIPLVPEQTIGLPFAHVPVLDIFTLAQLHVASSGEIKYALSLGGWVKPFAPEVGAILNATGEASAEVGYGLGILGGIADAGYTLGLGARLEVPVHVTIVPKPALNIPKACFRVNAFSRVWAQYLWGIHGLGFDTNPSYKQIFVDEPVGCVGPFNTLASRPMTDTIEPGPPPELFASPSVAVSPSGLVLSAYVEDTSPISTTPQVQIRARFQDPISGQWQDPITLSDPTHSATNPIVFFAGPAATPMVAWAEIPIDQATAISLGSDYNAHLSRQEIFYTSFKNGAWITPTRLTNDLLIDGMPTAAGNSTGAMLAWTRDTDGDLKTRSDQRIAVSQYNTVTAQFDPPELIGAPGGGLNNEVRVAYDAANVPNLVWINDADGNLDTANDRRITWAKHDPGGWVTLDPQPLPPYADSPALSAGPNGLELAFVVRQPETDGTVPILGPNGALWTAHLNNGQWTAAPLRNEVGGLVFAEKPVLTTQAGETLLAFRRFDRAGSSNALLGQISLSRDLGTKFSTPIYLTDEPLQNWQPALTVNPINRQAVILNVTRVQAAQRDLKLASISNDRAIAANQRATLSSSANPVESLTVVAAPDPALDPLRTTADVIPVGKPITVSVTLRNVGRDPATNMTITLYRGTPGSATPIGTQIVSGSLAMNEKKTLTFSLPSNGQQSVYAEMTTAGGNASTSNDRAAVVLGVPSAPEIAGIVADPWMTDTLDIGWTIPSDEQPGGYRILRSTSLTGTYELIGESATTIFADNQVHYRQTYCYQAQAHNNGALSPLSAPVCGELPLMKVYLPLIRR
jgi:hypothetical protein